MPLPSERPEPATADPSSLTSQETLELALGMHQLWHILASCLALNTSLKLTRVPASLQSEI